MKTYPLVLLICAAGMTHAAEGAEAPSLDAMFAQFDQDHDGKLSKAEAAKNSNLSGRFARADADHDGFLSKAEISAVRRNAGINDDGSRIQLTVSKADVNGHKLEYVKSGRGGPVIVFEAGAGGEGIARWEGLMPRLSAATTVVRYSRAGRETSDPVPGVRAPEAVTDDLHGLLAAIDCPPPYILVGASFGGMYARIFTLRFKGEVAGLVLLDSAHERITHEMEPSDAKRAEEDAKSDARWKKENDVNAMEQMGMAPIYRAGTLARFGEFPNIPLAVITVTEAEPKDAYSRRFLPVNRRLQNEWVEKSTSVMHIVVDDASHAMYVDDPEMVANAILWVLDTARRKAAHKE